MRSIYLIGSLRNPTVPHLGNELRKAGHDVFDDWHGAGPEADDKWKEYETLRGRTYKEALNGYAAKHVFAFDKTHLDRCDTGILVLPAGRSGHLELGYLCGQGKETYVLFDAEYDRWDVMYQFTKDRFWDMGDLLSALEKESSGVRPSDPTRGRNPSGLAFGSSDGVLRWKASTTPTGW